VARWDWWRGYHLHVDEDHLWMRSRFGSSVEVLCDDIRSVRIAPHGRPPDQRFRLLIRLRNGSEQSVVEDLRSAEPARFLEREIKRVLRLERAETETSAEAFARVWGEVAEAAQSPDR
jgi:hypothetical protein